MYAGADYIIALKKNAKALYEQARAPHLPAHVRRTLACGRGKLHTVRVSQDLGLLEACANWAGQNRTPHDHGQHPHPAPVPEFAGQP